jgi:hypothetical protein
MSTQVTTNPFFSPTQIPGCQLWLDAADTGSITLSGSSVTRWRDKSGSSNNFTPTSGTPTSISDNGRTVVNFTSGTIMRSANQITFTTSSAFFIVSRLNLINASNGGMLLVFTDIGGGDKSIRFFGPNGILAGTASMSGDGNELANNNYYVNGTFNPSFGSSTYLNTYSIIGTVSPSSGGTSYLAFSSSFYERFFIGNIAEFLYYPGGVTSSQRQQVEGYLAWKWGLQANLPSTHPYKNSLIPPLLNPPRALPAMLQNPTATFLPTQISGCQLWLDAADPTGTGTLPVGGSTLATWKDKSPNGFTGTALNSPTVQANILNGLPVIRFNGTNQYIDFGNILNLGTNGLSMFAVTKFAKPPDTIDNGGWIVGKTSYRGNYGRWGMGYDGYYSSGMTAYYEEVTTFVGPSFPFNPSTQFNLFSSQTNRTSFSRILLNGTLGAQSNFSLIPTNMSNTDSLFVASYGNSTGIAPLLTYNLNGDIAEILVYFATLTDAQRQQIEGYLAWKWGIQANLPTNHPYKAGPPYSATITAPSRSLGIAATWNPRQISGCALWLDGADVNGNGTNPLNGASVSTWTDKSGNGRNASQSTSANRPSVGTVNGRTAIVFSGSPVFMTLPDITSVPLSIFILAASTQNENNTFYVSLGGSPNAVFLREQFGPAIFGIDNGSGAGSYLTSVRDLNTHIWSFTLPASVSGTFAFDGSVVATSGFTLNSNTNFVSNSIGTWNQQSANGNIKAGISEIVMYNVDLSTSQRQNVEGYLAWKWGLVSSLPANHPFKRWPPSP